MLASVIPSFFAAMLSHHMGKHGLTFNIRVEGYEGAFRVGTSRTTPNCTIVFKNLLAFCMLARSPRLMTFAKLYLDGYVDADEGDWFALARIINQLNDSEPSLLGRVIRCLTSRQSIDVHYGWNAEAFACFLDQPYMQYTCGRLTDGDDAATLEESQLNKLRLIAEWLEVQPGQFHLDVGCGWGGLIQYLTAHHGTVSRGMTLSSEQANYARQHVTSLNALFFVTSFERHVSRKPYDIATVVGMLEHVPIARHLEFFSWLSARMRSGGRVYLQCITRVPTRSAGDRTRLLNQFVFAHELNTLENLRRLTQIVGFEVAAVEEGHKDYAFTTHEWAERIRTRKREIRTLLRDDKVFRILLGYLTMGSLSFAEHHSNLHRLLLVKR